MAEPATEAGAGCGTPGARRTFVCPGCGQDCERYHDREERWEQDLPILEAQKHVRFPRRRADGPRCGLAADLLLWLGKHTRVTNRLVESVARLCRGYGHERRL